MNPPSFAETTPAMVITLHNQRQVLVDTLEQYNTYGGLVMGVPEESMNDRLLRWTVESAKSRFGDNSKPFMIPPKLLSFSVPMQRHVHQQNGEFAPTCEPFSRIGRRLPKVTCLLSLRCAQPLAEPEENGWAYYSRAVLIWFQEEFAFPVDAEVMEKIQNLDWTAVAVDVSD